MKAAVDEKKRFDEFNTMGSEDTKFTAMAVISFLPLFNWLVSPWLKEISWRVDELLRDVRWFGKRLICEIAKCLNILSCV
jgi:hypothetical protein